MKKLFTIVIICVSVWSIAQAQQDTVTVHAINHASVMFEYKGVVVHVDPRAVSGIDYSQYPDADIIAITHSHGDHYSLSTINQVKKEGTIMVFAQEVKDRNDYADTSVVMANGDSLGIYGIGIKAVPAYDYEGSINHPPGQWNGYVFNFGDIRIYTAGDTDDIPEMADLEDIDVAFIPMNLPFTMNAAMAANAAEMIHPQILNIYHHDDELVPDLMDLLESAPFEIKVTPGTYMVLAAEEEPLNVNSDQSEFTVYPNPAQHEIVIKAPEKLDQVTIWDLSGKVRLQEEYQYNLIHLNLEKLQLETGIYLIGVRMSDRFSTRMLKYISR